MRYEVVLFDLDGTLVNSLEDIANAFNAALVSMGYPAADKELIKFFIGEPLRVRVMSVLPEGQKDERVVPVFRERFKKELWQRWSENTCPYEGVSEMLQGMVSLGFKIGILSNKIDDLTNQIATELFPDCKFSIVRGLLPEAPAKPNPEAAKIVANELGVSLNKIVYVGDTKTDMRTAVSSGMLPIGVDWGFQPATLLKEYGARFILEQPLDLLEILSAL